MKLSAEQTEFQSTARRFFQAEISSEYLRKRIAAAQDSDAVLWRKITEIGFLSSFGASSAGGFDLGIHELSLLAYEAGRSLVPEPVVGNIFFGPYLLSKLLEAGEQQHITELLGKGTLPKIVAGEMRVGYVPAYHGQKELTPSKLGLNGEAKFAFGFGSAAFGVVFSGPRKLYLLSLDSGMSLSRQPLLDGSIECKHVIFKNSRNVELCAIPAERVQALHEVLIAAELSGVSSKVLEMSAEYIKARKQFDVPIGGFQAVQHRLSDMYLASESMRALANFAAWCAENSPAQLALASKAALVYACEQAPLVVEGAIQLHGGIGFTWEFDLHLYLRRAKTLEALYRCADAGYSEILSLASKS